MFKIIVLALATLQLVNCIPNIGDPCNSTDRPIHIVGTCSRYLFCGGPTNGWMENTCHPGFRLDLTTMYCSITDPDCLPCSNYMRTTFEYKPVAGDCNKYYVCNEVKEMVKLACPVGLYYNSATRACDLPQNVTGC